MAKYPEGTVSPSGKHVVRGGKWIPVENAPAAAPADARPSGYQFAESLHTDEQGRTLSFPHMAVPAEPEARGYAMSAVTLPAGGVTGKALSKVPGVIGGAGKFLAARPTTAAGVAAAAPSLLRGDVKGAAVEGVMTAAGLKGAGNLLKFLLRFKKAQGVASEALKEVAKETAKVAAPAAKSATITGGTAGKTSIDEVIGQVNKWRTEHKFSDSQIVSSLRNVYGVSESNAKMMLKILAGSGGKTAPLQIPRVEIGAARVGKGLGMTTEEVRRQAGPVLNEALGEASPILPKEALKSIIDKMRAMPMSEREAYVARATSGKAQWQVENIRRTLEHLGLLLPAGAVAASVSGRER